jgi:hypothetical protein
LSPDRLPSKETTSFKTAGKDTKTIGEMSICGGQTQNRRGKRRVAS